MLWSQYLARSLARWSREISRMRGIAAVVLAQGSRRCYTDAISRRGIDELPIRRAGGSWGLVRGYSDIAILTGSYEALFAFQQSLSAMCAY